MKPKVIINNDNLNFLESEILNEALEIISEFEKLEPKQKSNFWITHNLKQKIGDLGEQKDFSISSSIHDSEWLYDLIWYQNDENNYLKKLFLILESELARGLHNLKYDFEKLLVSNADYKVFFCFNEGNFDYPSNVNRLISFFNNSVRNYENLSPNSRILILIWDDYMTGGLVPHLIVKVNQSN